MRGLAGGAVSRYWSDDRMPPRVPRPRDPEGRLIRPSLPARKPRTSVAAKILYAFGIVLLALIVVAVYNNYRVYRETTGPRYDCELSGGLYSSDLHACLRMPR